VTLLIGVSGWAQAGKDTLAGLIAAQPGWHVLHFADKLREACRALNPYVGFHPRGTRWRWVEMEAELGYEGAKNHPGFGDEFRRVMQNMGTEVGRNIFGPNIWVDATLNSMRPDDMGCVLADVRFPNEAQAITTRGGINVRVSRPGIGPQSNHASEMSLNSWPFDIRVTNDGTPEDMLAKFNDRIRNMQGGPFGS
jgi:hypothetical protein